MHLTPDGFCPPGPKAENFLEHFTGAPRDRRADRQGSENERERGGVGSGELTKHQTQGALARRANGEGVAEVTQSYNVSHSITSRLQVCITQ